MTLSKLVPNKMRFLGVVSYNSHGVLKTYTYSARYSKTMSCNCNATTKDVWLTAKVQYEKKILCLWGCSKLCPFLINTKKYKFACGNHHSICQSLCLQLFFHLYSYPHIIQPFLISLFNNWLYLSVSLQYEHVQQFCSDPADLSLPWWLECCLLHHSPSLHPHHPLPRHTGIPLRAAGLRMLHQNQNCSWSAPPARRGGLVVTMVTADTVFKGTATVDWWKRL